MAKLTFFLAVALVALVNVSRSVPAGLTRSGQDNFGGGQKRTQTKTFLPKPQSGRCGKQAGFDKWTEDPVEKYHKRSVEENASDIAPDKYIYAGDATGIAQYPWLVHVSVKLYTTDKKVCNKHGPKVCQLQSVSGYGKCGGSLVSSRHVVTAAHCFDHPNFTNHDVEIIMAEYNTHTYPTDCVGDKCITNLLLHPDKIHIHKDYKHERDTYFNDIAMLTFKVPAPYTDYIRPICLPAFNINVPRYEGSRLTVTGWGLTEKNRSSPVKLHTYVRMVAPNTCRVNYPLLTEGMLCAIGTRGEDVCSGDSGGPIMLELKGVFYLVGVVSAKRGECGSQVSTKYTNVFSYKEWIQDIIGLDFVHKLHG